MCNFGLHNLAVAGIKKFARTDYEIKSGKVQREYKAAVLADLHGFQYGKDNIRLLDAIRSGQPDLILIPGDMVVSRKSDTYETALKILEELCRIAPVYYSYGNHESRAHVRKSEYQEKFFAFEKKLKELGIHVLHNETEAFGELAVTGLEIPLSCYKKEWMCHFHRIILRKRFRSRRKIHFRCC